MKFVSINRNKIKIDDYKLLLKFTQWKNLVDENSPSYVIDVIIRAMIISAFNTEDSNKLKDFGLYSIYTIGQNKYPVREYEKIFIETLQPFNSLNKNNNITAIENNIRKNRLLYNKLMEEGRVNDIKKVKDKIRWYENIKMYITCVDDELDEYNRKFMDCEQYFIKKEIEKNRELNEVKQTTELNKKKVVVVEKKDELITQPEKPEDKPDAVSENKPKDKKDDLTSEEKYQKIKNDIKTGNFKIWCQKCKEKVVPENKTLITMTKAKGVKRAIVGYCPVHKTKISVLVPQQFDITDMR